MQLDIPYKGSRDYLHGTDLFNAMAVLTEAKTGISLAIMKPLLHPLVATEEKPQEPVARWQADGRLWHIAQDPSRTVNGRYPYDEDSVAAAAEISGEEITGHVRQASLIETAVAFQKRLLNAILGQQPWWFVQVDMTHVPYAKQITLRYKPSGTRLKMCRLSADGAEIGRIGFVARA